MANRKRWSWKEQRDGIWSVDLSSWKYFGTFLSQVLNSSLRFIWRGQQRIDWPLRSTFDRLIDHTKVEASRREWLMNGHLKQFKLAVRGRRGSNPPRLETENDWWALGQHQGLETPLLDWTTSPFVAAFFAFERENDKDSPGTRRAVWALDQHLVHATVINLSIDDVVNARAEFEKAKNTAVLPMEFVPPRLQVEFVVPMSDENPRLVSQNGLFSRAPLGVDLDSWVSTYFKGSDEPVLLKISIPNSGRVEFLRWLNRMNINHLTLFPDLYGASKFCNSRARIKGY